MKNTLYKFCLLICCIGFQFNVSGQLIITAVYDGPITGGVPKGVEVFVSETVTDLSIYGLGSANNGQGSDGEEFTFPSVSATAGSFIYVASESTQFTNYFGFAPDYTDSSMSINGDDAVELFKNGIVIDVYGEQSNTNESSWDYEDSWAYRDSGSTADGSIFNIGNWIIPGINVLDGCTSNATCSSMIPIGSYAAPLPIELLNFSLRSTDSQVELNWSTATEQDNDYFQLERAGADRNFEPLAKIEGAVNSTVMQAYSYTDEAPLAGISYYRLVQVDLDGTMHYHNTLSYQDNVKGDLTLYPNPAKDQIIIETEEMIGGTMELYDLSGRVIQSSIITRQQSAWSVSALQPGLYMISVEYNGLRLNNRFVKQ